MRNKIIKIRVTDSEYQELLDNSCDIKLAKWIRDTCLMRVQTNNRLRPRLDQLSALHLAVVANNIRIISHHVCKSSIRKTERIQLLAELSHISSVLTRIAEK